MSRVQQHASAKGMLPKDGQLEAIEELVLDGVRIKRFSAEDKEWLEQLKGLRQLALNSTLLNDLELFPALPKLEQLELTDNNLSAKSNLPALCAACPNLEVLSLAGNKFVNHNDFACLSALTKLMELDVEMNPFFIEESKQSEIRAWLFANIKTLTAIDNIDREGKELVEDSDESEEEESESDVPVAPRKRSVLADFYQKEFKTGADGEDGSDSEGADFNPDSFSDDDDEDDDDGGEEEEGEGDEGLADGKPENEPPEAEAVAGLPAAAKDEAAAAAVKIERKRKPDDQTRAADAGPEPKLPKQTQPPQERHSEPQQPDQPEPHLPEHESHQPAPEPPHPELHQLEAQAQCAQTGAN